MEEQSEKYLFEEMPVPRAVATLAIPTVISQVVTMIYNLADTFFVGQIGNPYMVAAVSLVSPWFNLLTALGNLFGLGASSLISRMLGVNNRRDIKHVAAFGIWGGAAVTLVFGLATWLARDGLLHFLGASADTYGYAESYLLWVVVLGGVPTMVSLALGHLLRSEGHARQASAGMMFGGILNVVLDPILIFGFSMDVEGGGYRDGPFQCRVGGFLYLSVCTPSGENSGFPESEVLHLPVCRTHFFSGPSIRTGDHPGQRIQYGDGASGFRLRRYSGGGLRHCQAH